MLSDNDNNDINNDDNNRMDADDARCGSPLFSGKSVFQPILAPIAGSAEGIAATGSVVSPLSSPLPDSDANEPGSLLHQHRMLLVKHQADKEREARMEEDIRYLRHQVQQRDKKIVSLEGSRQELTDRNEQLNKLIEKKEFVVQNQRSDKQGLLNKIDELTTQLHLREHEINVTRSHLRDLAGIPLEVDLVKGGTIDGTRALTHRERERRQFDKTIKLQTMTITLRRKLRDERARRHQLLEQTECAKMAAEDQYSFVMNQLEEVMSGRSDLFFEKEAYENDDYYNLMLDGSSGALERKSSQHGAALKGIISNVVAQQQQRRDSAMTLATIATIAELGQSVNGGSFNPEDGNYPFAAGGSFNPAASLNPNQPRRRKSTFASLRDNGEGYSVAFRGDFETRMCRKLDLTTTDDHYYDAKIQQSPFSATFRQLLAELSLVAQHAKKQHDQLVCSLSYIFDQATKGGRCILANPAVDQKIQLNNIIEFFNKTMKRIYLAVRSGTNSIIDKEKEVKEHWKAQRRAGVGVVDVGVQADIEDPRLAKEREEKEYLRQRISTLIKENTAKMTELTVVKDKAEANNKFLQVKLFELHDCIYDAMLTVFRHRYQFVSSVPNNFADVQHKSKLYTGQSNPQSTTNPLFSAQYNMAIGQATDGDKKLLRQFAYYMISDDYGTNVGSTTSDTNAGAMVTGACTGGGKDVNNNAKEFYRNTKERVMPTKDAIEKKRIIQEMMKNVKKEEKDVAGQASTAKPAHFSRRASLRQSKQHDGTSPANSGASSSATSPATVPLDVPPPQPTGAPPPLPVDPTIRAASSASVASIGNISFSMTSPTTQAEQPPPQPLTPVVPSTPRTLSLQHNGATRPAQYGSYRDRDLMPDPEGSVKDMAFLDLEPQANVVAAPTAVVRRHSGLSNTTKSTINIENNATAGVPLKGGAASDTGIGAIDINTYSVTASRHSLTQSANHRAARTIKKGNNTANSTAVGNAISRNENILLAPSGTARLPGGTTPAVNSGSSSAPATPLEFVSQELSHKKDQTPMNNNANANSNAAGHKLPTSRMEQWRNLQVNRWEQKKQQIIAEQRALHQATIVADPGTVYPPCDGRDTDDDTGDHYHYEVPPANNVIINANTNNASSSNENPANTYTTGFRRSLSGSLPTLNNRAAAHPNAVVSTTTRRSIVTYN